MGDIVFNIAKGKVNGYVDRVANNDPANSAIVVVLLQASEADATLQDYDTLSALIGAAGNTEATFTNYARKVLTDSVISAPAPDDTGNTQSADAPDQTWTSAGGTVDNTMTKVIFCYDPDSTGGTDADLVPLTAHDFTPTTNGNDLIMNLAAAGFYTAS